MTAFEMLACHVFDQSLCPMIGHKLGILGQYVQLLSKDDDDDNWEEEDKKNRTSLGYTFIVKAALILCLCLFIIHLICLVLFCIFA